MRKLLFASFVLLGCGGSHHSDGAPQSAALQKRLQAIADAAKVGNVQAVALAAESPKARAFAASGAVAPNAEGAPTTTSELRIASVSKMFVAATIMRFVERGEIGLDEPMATYLPAAAISGLSNIGGQDLTPTVTIRQLLSHRSGLADYETDGTPSEDGFTQFGQVQADAPDRLWSLQDTIDWTRQNLTTFAKPGEAYHYADTNYQLLGLVLEAVAKKPLYTVVRETILDPLQMNATYEQYREPSRERRLVHFWLGETDVTRVRSLSADYAGGGWVSSTKDLTTFLKALVGGRIVRKETYALMKTPLSEGIATFASPEFGSVKVGYGLGLIEWKVDGLGSFVGHDGFFNSYAFYWTDRNAYLAGSLNQTDADYPTLLLKSADALRQ